ISVKISNRKVINAGASTEVQWRLKAAVAVTQDDANCVVGRVGQRHVHMPVTIEVSRRHSERSAASRIGLRLEKFSRVTRGRLRQVKGKEQKREQETAGHKSSRPKRKHSVHGMPMLWIEPITAGDAVLGSNC